MIGSMTEDRLKLSRLMDLARRRAKRERDILILRDYLAGMRRPEIAAKYGLSKGSIYEITTRLVWYHEHSRDPLRRLPDDIVAQLKALEEEP